MGAYWSTAAPPLVTTLTIYSDSFFETLDFFSAAFVSLALVLGAAFVVALGVALVVAFVVALVVALVVAFVVAFVVALVVAI